MAQITEYLNPQRLANLQETFCTAAQAPIRILDTDGVKKGRQADGELRAPVFVDSDQVGWIIAAPDEASEPAVAERLLRFVELTADVVGRFCRQEDLLKARVEELAAVYRLMAEFSGRRDLQEILDIAAANVVEVLKAKACSIRLLNEDKTELLIKAVANLSPQYLDKGPIMLSDSKIDQEVLATGEPVYIADERTDPRVLYPAEARREGIVSALCAPMAYKGGIEGVIRVYTDRPHEFHWFEQSLLKAIAAGAASAVVNARLYAETVYSANLRRALNTAAEVQRRMIPAEPPKIPGFDIGTLYVPTHELSGDFFDFIELPEDNLGIAICDVCGKGVRASLLTAAIRASLRGHAANVYEMSEVLNKVNRDLCADSLTSDFATLFYSVLDVQQQRLTYANAGHLPPIFVRDGQSSALHTRGAVIGVDPDQRYGWESLQLQSGDVILAYTDGLSEALNFEDEAFGRHRVLSATLAAIEMQRDAQGIAKHVLWEMRRFAGLNIRFDDTTIIAIKVL